MARSRGLWKIQQNEQLNSPSRQSNVVDAMLGPHSHVRLDGFEKIPLRKKKEGPRSHHRPDKTIQDAWDGPWGLSAMLVVKYHNVPLAATVCAMRLTWALRGQAQARAARMRKTAPLDAHRTFETCNLLARSPECSHPCPAFCLPRARRHSGAAHT